MLLTGLRPMEAPQRQKKTMIPTRRMLPIREKAAAKAMAGAESRRNNGLVKLMTGKRQVVALFRRQRAHPLLPKVLCVHPGYARSGEEDLRRRHHS